MITPRDRSRALDAIAANGHDSLETRVALAIAEERERCLDVIRRCRCDFMDGTLSYSLGRVHACEDAERIITADAGPDAPAQGGG